LQDEGEGDLPTSDGGIAGRRAQNLLTFRAVPFKIRGFSSRREREGVGADALGGEFGFPG
jgi:hypothetical protein